MTTFYQIRRPREDRILEKIKKEPMRVSELAEKLGMSRPSVLVCLRHLVRVGRAERTVVRKSRIKVYWRLKEARR